MTAEQIVEQMRQVRCEMGEDVQGIVDNARAMTDWRGYVRAYPWLCIGAAAVVGYLVVPRRPQVIHPDAKALGDLVKSHQVVVRAETEPKAKGSIGSTIASVLSAAVLKGGMSLGQQYLNSYLQARQVHQQHDPNGEVWTP